VTDTDAIAELAEDFAGDIEALEDTLAPSISKALAASTSKLPLVEKVNLYVLAIYAIAPIVFSIIHLNGAQVEEHPISLGLS
jgi:hypothetical protein